MADDFQDDFIVDYTEADLRPRDQASEDDNLISQELRYSLETDHADEEVNIAVNLGPLVCGKKKAGQGTSSGILAKKTAGNKAAKMIPHFRYEKLRSTIAL